MTKKKILYIVEAMGGGVFTYIVDLANEMINSYEVYIAYAVRRQTPVQFQSYFDKRIKLIEVKNFCREIKIRKDVAAIKEIREIADKINPDIIHLHSSKAGVIGRIAFDGNKIALFYTPHGFSFLMKNKNLIKRKIYWYIEKMFAQKKCTIVSCSPGEYNESLKLTSNALYVNNAINTSELDKKINQVKKEKHEFTVFTLGRICYQKNPALFNLIAQAMPNVKFLWIGDGELKQELNSPNIEITGWLSREDALKRSINADVFILTSLWEGLPISLLEAMYMKKLCIVSNVIGNKDVIHNKENGYVCNSLDDYVNAIKEKKQEYIQNAYCDLMKKYESKVQAKRYLEIYKKKLEDFE